MKYVYEPHLLFLYIPLLIILNSSSSLPKVSFLFCCANHKRNIIIDSILLLPRLERRLAENVAINYSNRADKSALHWKIGDIISCPGRVLLPRNCLSRRRYIISATKSIPNISH